jgi:hypothetical protein
MMMDRNILVRDRMGAIPACPKKVKCNRDITCPVAIGRQHKDVPTLP